MPTAQRQCTCGRCFYSWLGKAWWDNNAKAYLADADDACPDCHTLVGVTRGQPWIILPKEVTNNDRGVY
jgi:hypothetical protein